MRQYQVICTNPDVFAIEAYGQAESPLFATEAEADAFLTQCVESWPEGSEVRDDYDLVVVEDFCGVTVCGCLIQHDTSGGHGHCWLDCDQVDCPADVQVEIECEIIDGEQESCDDYLASNGIHYRW